MKAMVLAAGLGTRLRPLTDNRPKALIEIGGRSLLEITLARLLTFGVQEVIINVHHFADQVLDYLKAHGNFGMQVEVSREDELLDTGGGLKKASNFFLRDAGLGNESFLLHNVDVLSTIDLGALIEAHRASGALATLAVQERQSSRHLLFDERMNLCGRRVGDRTEIVGPVPTHALAFCGIHAISPRLLPLMTEEGAFSIIQSYLRLAGEGEDIRAFRADGAYWRDLGRPEHLAQAERDREQKLVVI